ncbi:Ubiquitin fusion degradation protein 4 [Coemansia nantahalensis]|nr:Ubiquitin fusion degradation protein 4 [Coemansia nantahalensis]
MSGGDDSPLPPLVEVAADKSPARAPLVSADGSEPSVEATERGTGDSGATDAESMGDEQQRDAAVGTSGSSGQHPGRSAADPMDVDEGGGQSSTATRSKDGAPSGRNAARRSLFELGLESMTRVSAANQLRPLVAALKNNGDATQQLLALQELTELMAISTEDTLIGLDVHDVTRVLVNLVKGVGGDPDELGGFAVSTADIMLLACRCLANLLEALPVAGPVLLHHGAIPVLCGKLLDIEYIDVAEQALSVLARLSGDFAAQICEAGGMAACLMFLDFFATGTQRTALTCAANCARTIARAQFAQAREAMPVLERTAFHADQKIADLSCQAMLHVVTAFRSSPAQTEQLISEELLRSIVSSIHPASEHAAAGAGTAMVTLLRILATVVAVSGNRATQMLDMGLIPALAEVLAASNADPHGLLDPAQLVTRSRGAQHHSALQLPEREWETLRLLDSVQAQRLKDIYARPLVLQQLQDALIPLMVRVCTQTINVFARYRALLVILKAVYFLDTDRLRAALDAVNLPSFLAATVSRLESPLVSGVSLLITRIVLDRAPGLYTGQFVREGLVDGLSKLALSTEELLERTKRGLAASNSDHSGSESDGPPSSEDGERPSSNGLDLDELTAGFRLTDVNVPASSRHGTVGTAQRFYFATDALSAADEQEAPALIQWVLDQSRALSRTLDGSDGVPGVVGGGGGVLAGLSALAARFGAAGISRAELLACAEALAELLASASGVTCHELMQSGLVASLADALDGDGVKGSAGASDAVRCLLSRHAKDMPCSAATSTLGVLLGRLQEALSQAEQLHVCETYQAGADEARSPAQMLAKQIRFAVSPADTDAVGDADDGQEATAAAEAVMEHVRRSFQTLRVSVHAVATFSVLEAYLRPRIALLVRRNGRNRRHRGRLPAPAAMPAPAADGAEEAGDLRPREAQLDRATGFAAASDPDTRRRTRRRERIDMLRMIAQASGINLRAAALLEGLDLDLGASDGDSDAGSESDADGADDGPPDDDDDDGDARRPGSRSADSEAAGNKDDWRLSFVLHVGDAEAAVGAHDNIFRTVHRLWQQDQQQRGTCPWTQTFELRFRTEFGPRLPAAPDGQQPDSGAGSATGDEGLDNVLGAEGAAVVRLLGLLYNLIPQARLPAPALGPGHEDVIVADLNGLFVNRSITAKTARQLSDPLMVVCGALPDWCRRVVSCAPFLTSFGSRLAYMQAAFFGYSRNINYWQAVARREQRVDGHSPSADLQVIPLGHVQRQKVRISRHRILESALKVLELYGTAKTILEVEYFDEVGSGVGPTLEFYATISRCLQERGLSLWRDDGSVAAPGSSDPGATSSVDDAGYVCAPRGLFPAPIAGSEDGVSDGQSANVLSPSERTLQLFGFIGHLVAKGLIDGRILDIPLNTEFWVAVQRHLEAGPSAGAEIAWEWSQLEALDAQLASSLRYLQGFVDAKNAVYARRDRDAAAAQADIDAIRGPDGQTSIEDLALDFTLPGHPSVELRPGGAEVPVTISNVHAYIDLVAQWTLWRGVRGQVAAFCDGFDRVFSSRCLLVFTPAELACLVGQMAGDDEHWTRHSLQAAIKVDQGLVPSSPLFQMLLDLLVSLDRADRRRFLQFATGSARLPLGGFGALHPPLTIVPRPAEPPLTPDDYLPTVMTCANFIKQPSYSSPDVLAQRWRQAMSDGQQSFHLS